MSAFLKKRKSIYVILAYTEILFGITILLESQVWDYLLQLSLDKMQLRDLGLGCCSTEECTLICENIDYPGKKKGRKICPGINITLIHAFIYPYISCGPSTLFK